MEKGGARGERGREKGEGRLWEKATERLGLQVKLFGGYGQWLAHRFYVARLYCFSVLSCFLSRLYGILVRRDLGSNPNTNVKEMLAE